MPPTAPPTPSTETLGTAAAKAELRAKLAEMGYFGGEGGRTDDFELAVVAGILRVGLGKDVTESRDELVEEARLARDFWRCSSEVAKCQRQRLRSLAAKGGPGDDVAASVTFGEEAIRDPACLLEAFENVFLGGRRKGKIVIHIAGSIDPQPEAQA